MARITPTPRGLTRIPSGPTRTFLLASTPGAGAGRLAKLLDATGKVGEPIACFDPLTAPAFGREWSVLAGDDWAKRYLMAARDAATRGGICSVRLNWPHIRWLVSLARAGLRAADDDPRSDAELIAAWFPNGRYLHLHCDDTARQAWRWYLARHPEVPGPNAAQPSPDFQEVRWLETVVTRHYRAWETFFVVHGISAHALERDDLFSSPGPAIAEVLSWMGLSATRARLPNTVPPGPQERRADAWAEPYRATRRRLSGVVGVRSGPK
jgi:LPS sulfotransferase NodH